MDMNVAPVIQAVDNVLDLMKTNAAVVSMLPIH